MTMTTSTSTSATITSRGANAARRAASSVSAAAFFDVVNHRIDGTARLAHPLLQRIFQLSAELLLALLQLLLS